MYKVHSGVCTITLHVTQQILSQHLLYAKHCAGCIGSVVHHPVVGFNLNLIIYNQNSENK